MPKSYYVSWKDNWEAVYVNECGRERPVCTMLPALTARCYVQHSAWKAEVIKARAACDILNQGGPRAERLKRRLAT